MDKWATPPKRVTSPSWGPPPPCKQALRRNLKGTVLLSVITDQVYWENKIYELKRSISDTYRHLGVFIQRFDIYVP